MPCSHHYEQAKVSGSSLDEKRLGASEICRQLHIARKPHGLNDRALLGVQVANIRESKRNIEDEYRWWNHTIVAQDPTWGRYPESLRFSACSGGKQLKAAGT